MTGINTYTDKERRKVRRDNHSELDERFPKKKKHSVKPVVDEYAGWKSRDYIQHLNNENEID